MLFLITETEKWRNRYNRRGGSKEFNQTCHRREFRSKISLRRRERTLYHGGVYWRREILVEALIGMKRVMRAERSSYEQVEVDPEVNSLSALHNCMGMRLQN